MQHGIISACQRETSSLASLSQWAWLFEAATFDSGLKKEAQGHREAMNYRRFLVPSLSGFDVFGADNRLWPQEIGSEPARELKVNMPRYPTILPIRALMQGPVAACGRVCRAWNVESHKLALVRSLSFFPHDTPPPPQRWRLLPATPGRARAKPLPPPCQQLTAKRRTVMAQEGKPTSPPSSPPPAPPSPRGSALRVEWMRLSRRPPWKKRSVFLSLKRSDRAP